MCITLDIILKLWKIRLEYGYKHANACTQNFYSLNNAEEKFKKQQVFRRTQHHKATNKDHTHCFPIPPLPPDKKPQQTAAISSFPLVGLKFRNRKCWLLILCNLQCVRINIACRILYWKNSSDQLSLSPEHSVDQATSILMHLSSKLTVQVLDSRMGQFDLASEEKIENFVNCFCSYFFQTTSHLQKWQKMPQQVEFCPHSSLISSAVLDNSTFLRLFWTTGMIIAYNVRSSVRV